MRVGYEYKAVIGGIDYFDADIWSCVAENCTMSQRLEIGNVISGRLDISIKPKPGDAPQMASVDLYIRNDGGQWRDKGKYFIAKRVLNRDGTRLALECYDIIRSFAAPFLVYGQQPNWPMPMTQVLEWIQIGTGIEYDPRNVIDPSYVMDYPNERSIREVLGDIASAHAGNFIVNDRGQLRLVPAYSTGAEHVMELSAKDYYEKNNPFIVGRVTMFWDDSEFFTAGTDTNNELAVDNPIAVQQIVNDVYSKMSGHVHRSFETERAFINPLFELGDTVVTGGNRLVINGYRTYFSSEIASDIYNPSDDEIDDEFEFQGDMSRAFSRVIKDGSWYYGVSITRKNGIQIRRTDDASEMTMNSDMWEVIVNGEKVLYIDYTSDPPQFVFNGELGANVVIAGEVVTNTLYSENGAVADITVNRLRTDYQKPLNYLVRDQNTVHWIDIHDEEFLFMVSEVIEPGSEQYTTIDGQPLYWRNNEVGGKMTTTETDEPVMIYKYTDSVTGSWAHREHHHDYGVAIMPVLSLGRGDKNGRMKSNVFKHERGFRIEYTHSNGEDYFFDIGEDGITSNPPIRNTLANFDALDIRSNEFTVTVEDESFTFETPKDSEGRIISVNGHGANRSITYS